jgi:hypothetical protein
MSSLKSALVALALGFAIGAPARADDRPPTVEERAAIEAALRSNGFSSWEEIELDDGKWEIDDAVHADGRKYDVDLAPGTYALLKKEIDD